MAISPESLANLKRGNKRGPSKVTTTLKEAILQAAENAGDEGGMVGYLEAQARNQPAAFLSLLGKVIPLQVDGKLAGSMTLTVVSGVPRADS